MCGIVGCYLNRPMKQSDVNQMRGLRDALAHRGPDGAGEYIDEKIGLYLGHRRLSIIDLDPRSAQPMHTERQIISYNGEIYNYLELRAELEGEYKFKTNSDTEVILHAWDKWGEAALLKFDGMFALALQDQDGLHLITDCFGEKPLYLMEHDSGFYFSSEAAPLIRAFKPQWKPGEQSLAQFINLGYIEPPETGYVGLSSLEAGMHFLITPDHRLRKHRYWMPNAPIIPKGKIQPITSQDIDHLRDLLCVSLERRLRADVTVGLFLSGGVDSPLVGALAKKELGIDLQSYTVAFPDGQDESIRAAEIARHLGIKNTIINPQQDNSWKDAPANLVDVYGVPNDNMTALAVQSMCKTAKKHLTVALTGLGGDELFYGYNKYATFYNNKWLYDAPKALINILKILPISKAKTAVKLMSGSHMRQFLRVKNSTSQDVVDGLDFSPLENMLEMKIDGFAHQARFFDLVSTMPQSYIPAIDRGSMRESVEVRTPFLNRDLLEFVMQLDQRALIHTEKKLMLRGLLSRYLNLDLLTPTKQGFVYPMSRYFGQEGVNFACTDSLRKDHERIALRQCLLAEMTSDSLAA